MAKVACLRADALSEEAGNNALGFPVGGPVFDYKHGEFELPRVIYDETKSLQCFSGI